MGSEILRLEAKLLADLERVVVTFFAAANDDDEVAVHAKEMEAVAG